MASSVSKEFSRPCSITAASPTKGSRTRSSSWAWMDRKFAYLLLLLLSLPCFEAGGDLAMKDLPRCLDRSAPSPAPSYLGHTRSRGLFSAARWAGKTTGLRKDIARSGAGFRAAVLRPVVSASAHSTRPNQHVLAAVIPAGPSRGDQKTTGCTPFVRVEGIRRTYLIYRDAVYLVVDGEFLEFSVVQLHNLPVLFRHRLGHPVALGLRCAVRLFDCCGLFLYDVDDVNHHGQGWMLGALPAARDSVGARSVGTRCLTQREPDSPARAPVRPPSAKQARLSGSCASRHRSSSSKKGPARASGSSSFHPELSPRAIWTRQDPKARTHG